jgi:excisionase family DNA binding protein
MDDQVEEFCGTFSAAKLLGLSVGTVQALVEKSELQAWKTKGGHRRISMQSIRDYQRLHGLRSEPGQDHQLRVLVVEDHMATLELFRETFERWDLPIDCTTMSSALEALMDISSLKPDLLLTDLLMPGVDGLELLRILRGNPAFSSMVMVAMTGLSPAEIQERGGLPSNTFLVQKPVDMKWLQGFVTGLTALRRFPAS